VRLAVSLPVAGVPASEAVDVVRSAVGWGYEAAWASEVAGPDFASLLGAVAAAVPEMSLGVAVVPVQTRSPWLLAATAATLSQLSGGRFALGVGTSSEVIVEQWSGVPFERPLARVRETVGLLRTILAGERTAHDGEFERSRGYRLYAAPPAPVPLLIGALNPRSLRQAGELGDGVCLNQLGVEHLPQILGEVRTGAQEAGRDADALEVVARLFCWVTDDVAAARDLVRRAFAPYAATTVYNRFFRWLGFTEEMDALGAALAQGDRAGAATALSDRFVDALYVLGDADDVAGRVQAYVDGGVTIPVVACVGPGRAEAERTLRAVGERLRRA
jgi:probable F420-dependent oxidoreductase